MNSNMVKPGKYDHNIKYDHDSIFSHSYTTIFNLFINFLVG